MSPSAKSSTNPPKVTESSSPASEFIYYIATGGHIAELLRDHVRVPPEEECSYCGKVYPCNMRRVAEQAVRLLGRRTPSRSGRRSRSIGRPAW